MVELLVVIAIISLLIGLTFAGLSAALKSGQRAAALANLRSIGQGLSAYTLDYQGTLPGPMWPGQMPMLDPDREGRLVRELAPYMGISMPDAPVLVDLFVPPAYRSHPGAPELDTARTFVLNMEVAANGQIFNPWGSLTESEPAAPRRMVNIPQNTWALSDADQLHPRVSVAPWRANTPPETIHGKKRLALFFGGHVGTVEEEELESPVVTETAGSPPAHTGTSMSSTFWDTAPEPIGPTAIGFDTVSGDD